MNGTEQLNPKALTNLKAAYGEPSQAGFGSAVFHERIDSREDLEQLALAKYRFFVGPLWERYGEKAWMAPWKEVATRKANTDHDIVAELRAIADPLAALSVPMILDNNVTALSAVFDDPAVTELRVFSLGDGGAMSGLLIVGRRPALGETTFLIFLMD